MSLWNLPTAILILGTMWFGFTYGWEKYPALILIILFCLLFWSYHSNTDLLKEKIKAEILLIQAKAEYYKKMKK